MRTLHIAPGYSAAGSLRQALHMADRADEVLAFPDDLSCGPIASDDPDARASWWQQQIDWPELRDDLRAFWAQVDATDARVVVWFGTHSATELAFRLAWASHVGERPYYIVDVTRLRVPIQGKPGLTEPRKAASIVPPAALATLFGGERPVSPLEEVKHREDWARLKAENAPFRIVTPSGLASAPLDYFDQLLLDQATSDWKKTAYILGSALVQSSEPYYQIGDLSLLIRVLALIDEGRLIADGNPWDMKSFRIRLA